MILENITNDSLYCIDWAKADRMTFLNSQQPSPCAKQRQIVPGLCASQVWMKDVSAADPRSIKAQLSGCGDYRALWWQLKQLMQGRDLHPGMILCQSSELEREHLNYR